MLSRLCALALLSTAIYATDLNHDLIQLKPQTSAKTALLTGSGALAAGAVTQYALSSCFSNAPAMEARIKIASHAFLPFKWVSTLFGIKYSFTLSTKNPQVASGLITAATLSVGALTAWLIYRYQPEGKYGRAHHKLKKALQDEVLQALLDAEQTLLHNIDDAYIHSAYPRVHACNDLMAYHKALTNALELWNQVLNECTNQEIASMADQCIQAATPLLNDIKRCITIIRNEPDWVEQLRGYDTMLARQAQERAAIAQNQIALDMLLHHHS